MKKILVAALLGLLSFGAGLFGLFFAMPSFMPERVMEAEVFLDIIRVADSLAQLGLIPSELAHEQASTDSSTLHAGVAGSELWASGDSSAATQLAAIGRHSSDDSLHALMARMDKLVTENEALRKQLQDADAAETTRVDAATLSATLAKLDDKELRGILQQLDASVLEQLYLSASSKNQTRLLEALPADKAAGFVQNLMRGIPAPIAGTGAINPAG